MSDYQGAQAAKKERQKLTANPISNIASQIGGVVGGVVKTAGNAFGIMDRDMQKFMSDATEVRFAGDVRGTFSWQQTQSNAFANQLLGMKAQGTSYSNGQPKDLEGFVDQEIRKAAISNMARDFGWDEDIVNVVARGEWARQDQKKADHNTRKEAARSTAITTITTIATLWAGAAFGPALETGLASVGKAVGVAGDLAAKVGAQVVKTAVQVVDGSRNGAQGMLAGLANGALGALTMGGFEGGFDGSFTAQASNFLQNTGLGLGITYDRNQGWGGMLGIGRSDQNVSVSFSERGDTNINAGFAINQIGANLSASYNMQQGSHNVSVTKKYGDNMRVGVSHNSQTGSSLTGGYDLSVGGSPSLGLNFSLGQNGLTTSANIGGVSLGSNGPNGFQMSNPDWMGENISQAQANVQAEMNERLEKAKNKMINDDPTSKEEALKKLGLEGMDVADLTPEQKDKLIKEMAQIQENKPGGLNNREGVDTSRDNIFSQIGGGLLDGVQNIYNFYNGGAVSSHQLLVDSGGNVHPRTCFVAGTKVHTKDGLKSIEDVQIGEKVLSWNEKTGEREYKEVTELFLHEVELLYEVRIQRPLDGSPLSLVDETILETTWNHPFRRLKTDAYADRGQKVRKPDDSEWVEARYLNAGDILILQDGKEVAISGIRSYNVEPTKVYNFEVADNHTYFVGEDGVLVHNYEDNLLPQEKSEMWNRLNPDEKSVIRRFGYFFGSKIAEPTMNSLATAAELSSPGSLFEGTALNGEADAFRHAYWNAQLTLETNLNFAEAFTTAHETGETNNNPMEKEMDLKNNALGRSIAVQNPNATPDQLRRFVIDAINRGDGAIIVPNRSKVEEANRNLSNSLKNVGEEINQQQWDQIRKNYYRDIYSNPNQSTHTLIQNATPIYRAPTDEELRKKWNVNLNNGS